MKILELKPGHTYIIEKEDYTDVTKLAHALSDTVATTDLMSAGNSHSMYRTEQVCNAQRTLQSYGVDIFRLNPYILIIDETVHKKHADLTYYREGLDRLQIAVCDVNAILIIVRDENDICDSRYTFLS